MYTPVSRPSQMVTCISVSHDRAELHPRKLMPGHVKAIMIDFGYAKFHGGRTYLR